MNKQTHRRPYLDKAFRVSAAELKEVVEESGIRLLSNDGLVNNTVWYKGYLITEDERDQLQNRK